MADKHIARITADIEFADGEIRTIKPLTIKSLRKFIAIVENIRGEDSPTGMNDESITQMVEAVRIAMEKDYPDIAARDDIEDLIDVDIFNKILSVAMGNRITDPNEAAATV